MSDYGRSGGSALVTQGKAGPRLAGKPRVLLVDDHEPNLLALEALLERLPADLVRARSGEEALERLDEGEYAVVLLDVQMPVLDGFATLERLRRHDRVTPVLFITAGAGDRARVRRAYELGAVDFLAKPLDPDALRAKVRVFLELARARDEARARGKADAERERLALSEARYRSFVEATSQMVWVVGADGEVAEDSPSWRAFTGQRYEAWLGRGWLDALHPDDRERASQAWSRAVREGSFYEVEYRVRRHDGDYRLTRARGAPVRDEAGRVREWVGVNVDVTDQRRVEAERAQAGERLRALVDHAPLGVVEWGADFRIRSWSSGAEAMFGWSAAEAIGRRPDELGLVPTSDEPSVAAEFRRLQGGGAEGAVHRNRNRTKAGAVLDVEWYNATLGGEAGGDGGVLSFALDVTARVRAERELAASLDRAESANRMKDEFLATVSHELRTPLNAILGWASMLKAGALGPAKQEQALATIERNARAQARLVDDLLDVSRVLRGEFALATGVVELGRVAEAALDAVRPAAEAKGVRLEAALGEGAAVLGDAGRLQQVAWNLLSNAVKFTPSGGRARVVVRQAGSHAEFEVDDTGEGIAPEFLPHVFEPFRQQDGSITRRAGGLGLGLSIVRSLVELHGGVVEAHSPGPGRGARFVVRLPTALPRAEPARPVPPPSGVAERGASGPATRLDGVRVLVVDDEPDTRAFVAFVLEKRGARVTAVGSAEAALSELGRAAFDVLVSDLGMPGEDGLSLLRRVRALPREKGGHLPAVALTAYVGAEDRGRALRAGFNSHLAKPVEPSELVLAVAALATNGGP
jgi:PAS domain S-box-containing protein